MALDKDVFLSAAFKNVPKIGKGLKSNETSNKPGFLQGNRFTRLGKDWTEGWRLYERFFGYILHPRADLYSLV